MRSTHPLVKLPPPPPPPPPPLSVATAPGTCGLPYTVQEDEKTMFLQPCLVGRDRGRMRFGGRLTGSGSDGAAAMLWAAWTR